MPPRPTSDTPAAHVRLTFGDLAYGGDAVGRDPVTGMAVFGWPGIPGEEATVKVLTRRANLMRGRVVELHTASESRVEPPCPYFGRCGGCHWQHMAAEAQLSAKHGILRSQLSRLAGVEDPDALLANPIPSPTPFGYRNTSQFAIEPASRRLAYHVRGGRDLLPIEHCPISNRGINDALPLVNALLATPANDAEVAADRRGLMEVTRVAIRSSERTGQTVVVFQTLAPRASTRRAQNESVTTSTVEPDFAVTSGSSPAVTVGRRDVRRYARALNAESGETPAVTFVEAMSDGTLNHLGETRGAADLRNEALADMLTGARLSTPTHSAERAEPPLGAWVEELAGLHYWVAPEAFFQVNTSAAEQLLAEVLRHIPPRVESIVDAHAGVGTFALHAARRAAHVYGFETERSATAAAEWNTRAAGLRNVTFQTGRAESLLPRLRHSGRLDLVLLDPPRAGCSPSLLAEIDRREIPLIIYVSCDPSTLARDIKVLAGGYRLTSARVVDLFPQTYHIETVAVFERVRR